MSRDILKEFSKFDESGSKFKLAPDGRTEIGYEVCLDCDKLLYQGGRKKRSMFLFFFVITTSLLCLLLVSMIMVFAKVLFS